MSPLRLLILAGTVAAGLGLLVLPQYLVAQPASGTAGSAGGTPDRSAIEGIVRDYLLANPELLQEMADKLRDKQEAQASAQRDSVFKTAAKEVYDSEFQAVIGNPNGDVTLVEFFDYNCGYCKQALADTNELLRSDPKLKIVLKEFPVLGPDSVDAARVAVAFYKQAPEKYLEFHRALLSADSADGNGAIEIARKLGADAAKLSADLADPEVEANLTAVHNLARQLGINGTPTYVIGDHVLPGAAGADNLKAVIGSIRECGKVQCS